MTGFPVPVGSAHGLSRALSGLRRPVASRPYLMPLTPMGFHFDPSWTSSIDHSRETLPIRSLSPSQAMETCLQRTIGESKTSANIRVPKDASIRSLNRLQAIDSCPCQTSGSKKTKPNKPSREIVRPIPEPTASSRFVPPLPLGPPKTSSISPTPKGLSARSLARLQAAEPCLRRAFRSSETKSSGRIP